MTGFGVFEWIDGRSYGGDWNQNTMNGFGMYQWPNDSMFTGFYKDDQKHGYGEYEWKDGKYQGYWNEGKQHGVGYMKFQDWYRQKHQLKYQEEAKHGVWEQGIRKTWLSDEEISSINFERPEDFNQNIKEIEDKSQEVREKIRNILEEIEIQEN